MRPTVARFFMDMCPSEIPAKIHQGKGNLITYVYHEAPLVCLVLLSPPPMDNLEELSDSSYILIPMFTMQNDWRKSSQRDTEFSGKDHGQMLT